MMNNSISPKEIYSYLMAISAFISALAVKVSGDSILDSLLVFATVALVLHFGYKSYKANRCTSEQKPAEE